MGYAWQSKEIYHVIPEQSVSVFENGSIGSLEQEQPWHLVDGKLKNLAEMRRRAFLPAFQSDEDTACS